MTAASPGWTHALPPRAPPAAPSPSQAFFRRYRRAPAPRAAAPAPSPPPAAPAPAALDLDALLARVHAASCCLPSHGPSAVTLISGTGRHMGLDVTWSLSLRGDGAYREDIASPFLSFVSGYDGGATPGAAAWDVDSSGVCHSLELDDHEAAVMGAWTRAGAWAAPALRSRLEMEIVDGADSNSGEGGGEGTVAVRVRLRGGRVAATVAVDPGSWRVASVAVTMCNDSVTWRLLDWRAWGGGAVPCPQCFQHDSLSGGQQELAVEAVEAGASPAAALAASAALLGGAVAAAAVAASGCPFAAPPQPLLPADASFDEAAPATVPVWYTRSGHVLVRADVGDTAAAGYFILDTGASGFVVEPAAADALGLEAFGEVHITGMAGKMKGQFRRASVFRVGPLTIRNAVMMEMSCKGLVWGGPGPVLGIVGHEVFRRAVVDLPPMVRPKSAAQEAREAAAAMSPAAALAYAALPKPKRARRLGPGSDADDTPPPHAHLALLHPERAGAVLDGVADGDWMPVTLLSFLPHVEVGLSMGAAPSDSGSGAGSGSISDVQRGETAAKRALLLMDTGAGGMSVMINARGAAELGLGAASGGRTVRGVGGAAAGGVTLKNATIGALEVGGARFEAVPCLVSPEGAGAAVDLSHYSAGILCGDLLSRCRLVLDLPRGRMAVLPGGREDKAAAAAAEE